MDMHADTTAESSDRGGTQPQICNTELTDLVLLLYHSDKNEGIIKEQL